VSAGRMSSEQLSSQFVFIQARVVQRAKKERRCCTKNGQHEVDSADRIML